jgi:hypothetical protein
MTSIAPAASPAGTPIWRRKIALLSGLARADAAALGVLALIVVVLCWPVLGQGRVYWERDVHLYLYPRAEAFVRVLAQGSLPLWNPYGAFGEPLLANPFTEVFYPPTWLHLLMRPWTWYAGFVVGHLLFTAAGAYLLARRLGTSRMGAFLAGGAWVASGPLLSLISLSHHFTGAAWIPWVVASSDYALAKGRARDVLAAGAVLALQIAAGSADMCALAGVLAAANALRHVEWTALRGRHNLRLVLTGTLALALGLGLSAAQWVPALALAGRSSRSELPERIRTYWSVHPAALAQAVLPVPLHTLPLSDGTRAALFESREPFLVSLYLGLAAGVLVLAAIVEMRLARVIALLLVLIVLIALGRHTPFFGLVTTLIPPLRILRYPVKAMVPAALLWSVLAGLGIDALRQAGRRRSHVAIFTLAVTVISLAVALGITAARRPEAVGAAYLQRGALDPPFSVAVLPAARHVLLAAGLAAGVAALAALAARRRWAAPTLALLAILDLVLANHGLNLTCAPELMAWRPPSVDVIRATDGGRAYSYDYYVATRGRASLSHPPYALGAAPSDPVTGAVALRGALFPSVLGQWGVESSYDLDQTGLFSREMAILSRFLRLAEGTPTHSRLLRMGAVTRVAAMHTAGFEDLALVATLPTLFQEPLRVYAVPDPIPRVHVVGGVFVADGDAALATLQDASFDPARAVILPTGTPVAAPPRAPGRCRVVSWKPDRIAVETDMESPGYLVFADAYDPGWRTRVDGRPTRLLRADFALARGRGARRPAPRRVHLSPACGGPRSRGVGGQRDPRRRRLVAAWRLKAPP